MIAAIMKVRGASYQVLLAPQLLNDIQRQSAKADRVALKTKSILVDMGNIYKTVEYRGVAISIYQDDRLLKSGRTSIRFRVPYTATDGQIYYETFTNRPDEAEAFALATAKRIKAIKNMATVPNPAQQSRVATALQAVPNLEKNGRDMLVSGQEVGTVYDEIDRRIPGISLLQVGMAGIDVLESQMPEKPATVACILPFYLEAGRLRLDRGKINVAAYKRFVAQAKNFTTERGSLFFHNVTSEQIENHFLQNRELKFNTATQYLGSLRDFFNFARKKKALAKSQVQTKADLAVLEEVDFESASGTNEIGVFTAVQTALLFAIAWADKSSRQWVIVMALRFFTGLHLSEICELRYRDFVKIRRAINVSKEVSGANHSARFACLSPDNWTWIEVFLRLAIRKGNLDDPIIPGILHYSKSRYESISKAYNTVFDKWLAAAGLDKIKNVARHSYPSHAIRLTNNAKWVSRQMGSHVSTVFRFYINHLDLDDPNEYFEIRRPRTTARNIPPIKWLPNGTMRTLDDLLGDLDEADHARTRKR